MFRKLSSTTGVEDRNPDQSFDLRFSQTSQTSQTLRAGSSGDRSGPACRFGPHCGSAPQAHLLLFATTHDLLPGLAAVENVTGLAVLKLLEMKLVPNYRVLLRLSK